MKDVFTTLTKMKVGQAEAKGGWDYMTFVLHSSKSSCSSSCLLPGVRGENAAGCQGLGRAACPELTHPSGGNRERNANCGG